jgi:hypothetical protein
MEEEIILYGSDGEALDPSAGRSSPPVWSFRMLALIAVSVVVAIPSYEMGKNDQAKVDRGFYASGGTVGGGILITTSGTSGTGWVVNTGPQSQPKEPPNLSPPADAPPPKIKVGPNHYVVKWTSGEYLAAQGALAQSDTAKHIIWLNPKRTAETLRDDMLHELMHCAADLGSAGGRARSPYDVEEDEIEYVSSGMLQVVQDNPQLLLWLTQTR